jgi:hypothetical protein
MILHDAGNRLTMRAVKDKVIGELKDEGGNLKLEKSGMEKSRQSIAPAKSQAAPLGVEMKRLGCRRLKTWRSDGAGGKLYRRRDIVNR